MEKNPILVEELNSISKYGFLDEYKDLPDFIVKNLSQQFAIREYQTEAIARLRYYLSDKHSDKNFPIHLLFHMATGSGKTFLMAANILHLYKHGYRNFIFFVNSETVIKKTKANFLDKSSPKYLFAEHIMLDNKEVIIQEVENFEGVNKDNINILFATIQKLHSQMQNPRENKITFEDFEDKEIVFLSDEAHHINAMTKNQAKLNVEEKLRHTSWENTIIKAFQKNNKNIMLEYTATIDFENSDIRDKYEDKIVYQYTLKEFREDKFSKDIHIVESSLDPMDRTLQAVILSQYRRKVAEKYKIHLKPVMLIKSKTIDESKENKAGFKRMIENLTVDSVRKVERSNTNGVIAKAFSYFKDNKIIHENLVHEIKEDFSEEKCIAINSKEDSEDKQIKVNTLEDEYNEVRVIFTVNMLNEGWDVLNLFDIVRLYETRDSRHGKPGKTTIAEAQLIGRGARYYPFALNEGEDKFKRKYDDDIDNELRVLEELHYHSVNSPIYISEIKAELVRTGIVPPDNKRKEIVISIKDEIQKKRFWKNGLIFFNEQKEVNRSKIKRMSHLVSKTTFLHELSVNKTTEIGVFDDASQSSKQEPQISKSFKFNHHSDKHITRKSLDNIEFFHFSNLKKYFPSLKSVDEFLTSKSYLGEVDIEIRGTKKRLNNLSNSDKYEIAIDVFKQLADKIKANTTEYEGTKEFKGHKLSTLVPSSKTSEILIGGNDKEYGVAMSKTDNATLQLCLKDCQWYVYDENYGTDQEKHLVRFVYHAMENLEKKYKDIYLLRNEQEFKIYRFSDGKAFAPDFILFLTEKNTKKQISLQLFIEPKGQQLLIHDKWKEDFLKDIESQSKTIKIHASKKYRLIGLPFYNETATKKDFESDFGAKLKLPK